MNLFPGLNGEVTHPPGTRYVVLTIPPDATDEDFGRVSATVREAIKVIQPDLMTQVLIEDRHLIAPIQP